MIRHERTGREGIDVLKDEVPDITNPIAAKVAPELRVACRVAVEGITVPPAGHGVVEEAVERVGQAVDAPIDGLSALVVVRKGTGPVAEMMPIDVEALERGSAVRGAGRSTMPSELKAPLLQAI